MIKRILHIFTPLVLFIIYLLIMVAKINFGGQNSPEAMEIFTFPIAVIIICAAIVDVGCSFVFSNKTLWIWVTEIIILLITIYLWIIQ